MKKFILAIIAVAVVALSCAFVMAQYRQGKSMSGNYNQIILSDGTAITLGRNHFTALDDQIFSAQVAKCKKGDVATICFVDGKQHQIVCKGVAVATIQDGLLVVNGECIHGEADYLIYLIGDERKYIYVWLWDIVCPMC